MRTSILLLFALTAATAADPIRATIQPPSERKPAPEFALHDARGKTVTLAKLRGKVVLLDFWATWCHGCKEEIPWFVEFQKTYGPKGLSVVGISVDEGGWKVLRPFLAANRVPYRMLLGSEATMQTFGLAALPDTFLIDQKGRIAATYNGGIVNREDIEANIRAILAR
jgi:cytochrome c biogenesis protein CcmG/thiol:disulfide interchange protein DsbE